jgi:peptidoglycan/xylan/chitin deacetylase (PgdA/CDA1 family)
MILRAFDSGNEIANHSWSHPQLSRLSHGQIRSELQRTNDIIEEVTGVAPNNMRPPYGAMNNNVINVSGELGLSLIIWSVDPEDWRYRNSGRIYNHVMTNVRDGDVILLHDLYESTAAAAVRLIPSLLARGFQLVTVSELFYYTGLEMEPGVVYHRP